MLLCKFAKCLNANYRATNNLLYLKHKQTSLLEHDEVNWETPISTKLLWLDFYLKSGLVWIYLIFLLVTFYAFQLILS